MPPHPGTHSPVPGSRSIQSFPISPTVPRACWMIRKLINVVETAVFILPALPAQKLRYNDCATPPPMATAINTLVIAYDAPTEPALLH